MIEQLLQSIIQSRSSMDHEFEIKFKLPVQHGDVNLIEELLKKKNFRTVQKNKMSKVSIFPEGYRQIDDTYEKKQRVNKPRHVVDALKTLEQEYYIKITESKEMKYSKIPFTSKDIIMKRDRIRSSYDNKSYRCDISYLIAQKEYELELELKERKPSLTLVFEILRILQKGELLSKSESKDVISGIKQLSGTIFPGALPFTIRKAQVEQGLLACGYAMSDKSDGERVILFVNAKGTVYGIRRNRMISKHFTVSSHYNSMFDCEKIDDVFYLFDTIYVNGKSVKDKTYIERIDAFKDLQHKQIKQKKVYLQNIKNHIEQARKVNYETDGIIFTPIFKPYYNTQIYKWKPNNTAEFLVKRKGSKYALHIASETSVTDKTYTHFPFSGIDGKGTFVHKGEEIHNQMFDQESGIISQVDSPLGILDDFVAEFEWKDNAWKFMKVRYDKQFANHVSTINDIWESIVRPVSFSDLQESLNYNCVRKYHNAIKKHVIQSYTKDANVLDIGIGAGGDIHKYEKAGAKHLTGIDIVDVEYEPIQKGFLTFHKVKGTMYNLSKLSTKKFDVITSFFSIHYLFESENSIRNLCTNLQNALKVNGYFICTFMNGDKIKNETTSLYEIKKLDESTIEVDIKGTKYFKHKKSKEFIVHPDRLQSMLEEYDIILDSQFDFQEKSHLQEHELLTNLEKQLSYLHICMIFKKRRKTTKKKTESISIVK